MASKAPIKPYDLRNFKEMSKITSLSFYRIVVSSLRYGALAQLVRAVES